MAAKDDSYNFVKNFEFGRYGGSGKGGGRRGG